MAIPTATARFTAARWLAPPLSIYVHVPWCLRKCPYCDFNSHQVPASGAPEAAYLEALLRDLDHDLPLTGGRTVDSVFIGGGTPSLLSAATMAVLLRAIHSRLRCAPDLEVTLEANPGTLEQARFAAFREAGVTRLSIGVQSLDDTQLRSLGRVHDAAQARAAAAGAHAAGFAELNLDLMYGLPGQVPAQALNDLEAALALAPTHLSWYQLTIEPNTRFAHSPPILPGEDEIAEMEQRGRALLAGHGFERYEVSAYARSGHRCRHNLNYWGFGDYLGIGAGAHSKLTDTRTGRVIRYAKPRQPAEYLASIGGPAVRTGLRELDSADLVAEFMLNALRLVEGFPLGLLEERTGVPLQAVEATLSRACRRGLLERHGEWLRPTELGRSFLDDLTAMFLL